MKTEQEIKDKLKWLIDALDDADNQTMVQQCKLYAQIDLIKWLGGAVMRIFGFSNHLNRWQRVEDEMYLVWIGNQTGAILPRWQDADFIKCMDTLKKKYTLKQCEKELHI